MQKRRRLRRLFAVVVLRLAALRDEDVVEFGRARSVFYHGDLRGAFGNDVHQCTARNQDVVSAMGEESADTEEQVRSDLVAVLLRRPRCVTGSGEHIDVDVRTVGRYEAADLEREL